MEQVANELERQAEKAEQEEKAEQVENVERQEEKIERPAAQLPDSLLMVQVENVAHEKFEHTEEVKVGTDWRSVVKNGA